MDSSPQRPVRAVLAAAACAAIATPALASTLILPLRSIGVSDTTTTVVGELLRGELESRGVVVLGTPAPAAGTVTAPCDEVDCAAAAATRRGAANVVYGSLSRLGDKIVVRVRVLRAGESAPWFVDQLSALEEEDLDAVVRRVADGIAAGQADSERATIETVTLAETLEPRRRATRGGLGLRAGFLFPVADSYGGAARLTSVRLAYKFETPTLLIDSTTLAGLAWGEGNVDWSILDLFAARLLGLGDLAPYVGGGLGVHSVHIEQRRRVDAGYYTYDDVYAEQTETVLSASLGAGLLALRTYDFVLVLDVRFQHTFANFGEAGGDGASGIAVTFGTSR